MTQRSDSLERRVFGVTVSVLLTFLAWTGNRLVAHLDEINRTVGEHGEILGRFDERIMHVEKMLQRMGP